jgi:hypothetical protein
MNSSIAEQHNFLDVMIGAIEDEGHSEDDMIDE